MCSYAVGLITVIDMAEISLDAVHCGIKIT